MPEPNSADPIENPKLPKGFSFLTLILMFTIAGIGLSHVQTTYQLQQLEKEHRQLLIAHSKISSYDVSEQLAKSLAELNIFRVGDLAGMPEVDLMHSPGVDDRTMEELRSLLKSLDLELGN